MEAMLAGPRVWQRIRQTVYSAGGFDPARPIAAFDFDSTLWPYRGRGPPVSLTLCFLTGLSASFNIVIISNRSSDSEEALAPLKEYVAALDFVTAGPKVTVYASTAHDRDRKPHTGTWEHYMATTGFNARPRFAFYCGDAAGRPGDHSASDYAFALNIGIPFTTPEAIFYGKTPWVNPKSAGYSSPLPEGLTTRSIENEKPFDRLLELSRPYAIIMIGSPASGKSHIVKQLVQQRGALVVVSGDLQGPRHKRKFGDALGVKLDVVVDNTNPLTEDRAFFAEKARAADYTIVFCHVATPKEICFHLNAARCQQNTTGGTPELAPVVLHTYWKRRELPTEEEAAAFGAQLIEIPFELASDAPKEVKEYRYA